MSLLLLVCLFSVFPVFADAIAPPIYETHTTHTAVIALAVAVVLVAAAVILWVILRRRRK